MNLRPRCREWLPLNTQQLRLRNLMRIEGLNIKCASNNDDAVIFYTLHQNKDSDAFYTSEALPQRHLQQKWAEIDAGDELRKSNANCVCVKVWAHFATAYKKQAEQETESKCVMTVGINGAIKCKEPRSSALFKQLNNVCLTPNKLPRPPETLLFTWAVYFSGLVPLIQNSDANLRANNLIFQLNGEYFTSPQQFTIDGLRDQLSLHYQRYSASVPKLIQTKYNELSINSPTVSRSSSPVNMDKSNNLLRMPTIRYAQLNCPLSEVRKSYNLKQLLKIQELQRLHVQKLRACRDIITDIKHLSVRCITRAELPHKPRTTSVSTSASSYHRHYHYQQQYQHHSMGRTLSVLLAEQQEIAPLTLYTAQQLESQIETLRCKKRLLQTEHATYAKRLTEQQQHLLELKCARAELQKMLEDRIKQLHVERMQLISMQQKLLQQKEQKENVQQQMKRRTAMLCMELGEIYNIERLQTGFYSICGIQCPYIDVFMNEREHYAQNMHFEPITPIALSAALSYIARLVQMLAIINNRPLRNPIVVYRRSEIRVMDLIKEFPFSSRQFPLYTRSLIPSKFVKYGMYLLNQNIAQLLYDLTRRRCDLQATFENILSIFNSLAQIEQNSCKIEQIATVKQDTLCVLLTDEIETSKANLDRLKIEQGNLNNADDANNRDDAESLSKSNSSSVDMPIMHSVHNLPPFLHLLPPTSTDALAIEGYASTQRICRSVGSYSDCEDDFKGIIEHAYSNSDSNITMKRA